MCTCGRRLGRKGEVVRYEVRVGLEVENEVRFGLVLTLALGRCLSGLELVMRLDEIIVVALQPTTTHRSAYTDLGTIRNARVRCLYTLFLSSCMRFEHISRRDQVKLQIPLS